jgi:predicted nucleic acid-binding protein
MDSFDADVLIYAAVPGHELGRRVRAVLPDEPVSEREPPAGIGSVLLLPELLSKPIREAVHEEVSALAALLSRLELLPVDEATAGLAVALGAKYGLKALDAVHLATGVGSGADRFLTNNERDFSKTITEIDITYPADLPDPA